MVLLAQVAFCVVVVAAAVTLSPSRALAGTRRAGDHGRNLLSSPGSRELLADEADPNVRQCDWTKGHEDCELGYSCIPCSTDAAGAAASKACLGGTAVCVKESGGGNFLPPDLGMPVMYFPLSGHSLEAWPPQADSWATAHLMFGNITWGSRSDTFPYAMWCDQDSNSLVGVEGLTYGRSGGFTINLWMRKANNDLSRDVDYEFLFSHSPHTVEDAQFYDYKYNDPDQLNLYLMPKGNNLAGLARAIVKDDNDQQVTLFLDSDGYVNDTIRATPFEGYTDLLDGFWHMVTLSSQPNGGRGFRLYVDGQLANEIPNAFWPTSDITPRAPGEGVHRLYGRNPGYGDRPYDASGHVDVTAYYPPPSDSTTSPEESSNGTDGGFRGLLEGAWEAAQDSSGNARRLASAADNSDGSEDPPGYEVDGGNRLVLTGPLLLCGRYDNERRRAYEGGIAHLMVFDGALDDATVARLYNYALYRSQAPVSTPIVAPTMYGRTTSQDQPTWKFPLPESMTPAAIDDGLSVDDRSSDPSAVYNPDDPSLPTAVYDIKEGDSCSLDLSLVHGLRFCQSGLVCAPDYERTFYTGTCGKPEGGMLLPTASAQQWPAPMAHFPLTSSTLDSWPNRKYGQDPDQTSSDFTFTADARFGSTLSCNKTGGSKVFLQPVPYAANGAFTINIWVKMTMGTMGGFDFEYFYSHTSKDAALLDPFQPNNVHLFVPELQSVFYGVSVRTVLRDATDENTGRESQVFLDSDGRASTDPTLEGKQDDGVDIGDGEWHMVTLTTLTPTSPFDITPKGHALYVDGVLRGRLDASSQRATPDPLEKQIQVTGGRPANLDNSIVLCGRSDQHPERYFTGQLAALSLWDVAFGDREVAQLFTEYQRSAVLYPAASVSAMASATSDMASEPCVFPISFGGVLYSECTYMGGTYGCPTKSGAWRSCPTGDTLLQQVVTNYKMADGVRVVPTPRVTMSTDNQDRLPVLTVGGQECRFPFSYNGEVFGTCMQANGTSWCKPVGGDDLLLECAARVVRRPDATTCGMLLKRDTAGDRPQDPNPFVACVSTLGVDTCQTPEGAWVFCPPQPRMTASGKTCLFPNTIDGIIHTDCYGTYDEYPKCPALPAGANAPGSKQLDPSTLATEDCQIAWHDPPQLAPLEPIRLTLDRQRCVAPGPGALSDCLQTESSNGAFVCDVDSDVTLEMLECAPVTRVGAATGGNCSFPFVYRGVNRSDCTWLDGVQACKLADGSWEQCSAAITMSMPSPPMRAMPRVTFTGSACSFPFYFDASKYTRSTNSTGPQLQWGCVRVGGSNGTYCPTAPGGALEICMDWQPDSNRVTASGLKCVAPYIYQGKLVRSGCTPIALKGMDAEVCLNEDGVIETCAPVVTKKNGGATSSPPASTTTTPPAAAVPTDPGTTAAAPAATPAAGSTATAQPAGGTSSTSGTTVAAAQQPSSGSTSTSSSSGGDSGPSTTAIVTVSVLMSLLAVSLAMGAFLLARRIMARRHRRRFMADVIGDGLDGPEAGCAMGPESSSGRQGPNSSSSSKGSKNSAALDSANIAVIPNRRSQGSYWGPFNKLNSNGLLASFPYLSHDPRVSSLAAGGSSSNGPLLDSRATLSSGGGAAGNSVELELGVPSSQVVSPTQLAPGNVNQLNAALSAHRYDPLSPQPSGALTSYPSGTLTDSYLPPTISQAFGRTASTAIAIPPSAASGSTTSGPSPLESSPSTSANTRFPRLTHMPHSFGAASSTVSAAAVAASSLSPVAAGSPAPPPASRSPFAPRPASTAGAPANPPLPVSVPISGNPFLEQPSAVQYGPLSAAVSYQSAASNISSARTTPTPSPFYSPVATGQSAAASAAALPQPPPAAAPIPGMSPTTHAPSPFSFAPVRSASVTSNTGLLPSASSGASSRGVPSHPAMRPQSSAGPAEVAAAPTVAPAPAAVAAVPAAAEPEDAARQ